MATAKKYNTTKREMFETLKVIVENTEIEMENTSIEELLERLDHEIELIARKSGSVNTEKVKEDNRLKEVILEVLGDGERKTVSEIQNANSALSIAEGVNNSKVTALLRKLVADGSVVNTKEKKKSYYALAS